MPRRWFSSLDTRELPDGRQIVDVRETTSPAKELERKEILLSGYYGQFGGTSSAQLTGLAGRPWDLNRAVREAYARVVWVYRCVEAYAGRSSRLRLIPVQGPEDEPEVLDEGDFPAIGLLQPRAKCNPLETGRVYRKRLGMQALLSSRGTFTEVETARSGTPLSYTLLPPWRVRVHPILTGPNKGGIDHFELLPSKAGDKSRNLDPDQVRWVREPHPDDPYAGMTPLEAAGLSVEVDHFTRLFNRSAVANDGRPGMILALKPSDPQTDRGRLDPREAERIERKFDGGPLGANRTVVLDGEISSVDMGGVPRDGAWLQLSRAGKEEILAAFNMSLVILGQTADQTFANASEGRYNWYAGPFADFCDLLCDVWDVDAPDPARIVHDVSSIVDMDVPKRIRREEARTEVQMSLRTGLSYAKLSKQSVGSEPGDFPDEPGTRAVWITGGVPIAGTPEDQAAAEKLTQIGGASQPPGGAGGPPTTGIGGTPGGGPGGGGGNLGAYAPVGSQPVEGKAHPGGTPRERRLRAVGDRGSPEDDAEAERVADHASATLAAALESLSHRLTEVTLARVSGVKARRGTRHWDPGPGRPWELKQLDANAVVDPQQWSDQAQAAALETLAPAAADAYQSTQQQLTSDLPGQPVPDHGGAQLAAKLVVAYLAYQAALTAGETAAAAMAAAVAAVPVSMAGAIGLLVLPLAQAVRWTAQTAYNRGVDLSDEVAKAEAADAARVAAGGERLGVAPIVDRIRGWAAGAKSWAENRAGDAATMTVNGARHVLLRTMGDRLERTWRTRLDDRVRPTHRAAEGQTVTGEHPFLVGGAELRYPGDPLGPPAETFGCRCHIGYRYALPGGQGLAVGAEWTPVGGRSAAAMARRRARGAKVLPFPDLIAQVSRGLERKATAFLDGLDTGSVLHESRNETKVRHVRTSEGARRYGLPIGSPISAHAVAAAEHDVARVKPPEASVSWRNGTVDPSMTTFLYDGLPADPNDQDVAAIAAKADVANRLAERLDKQQLEAFGRDSGYTDDPVHWGASRLVSSWAATSNDHDPQALALQRAVAEELGITDHADWATDTSTGEEAQQHYDQWGSLYRSFARAQYDETQARFAAAGITHVRVYRGFKWQDQEGTPDWARNPAGGAAAHTAEVKLRPASSFTVDPEVAEKFATDWGDHESYSIVAADVPVSLVLGTPRSGWGCLRESEVVMLASDGVFSIDSDGLDEDFLPTREDRLAEHAATPVGVMGLDDLRSAVEAEVFKPTTPQRRADLVRRAKQWPEQARRFIPKDWYGKAAAPGPAIDETMKQSSDYPSDESEDWLRVRTWDVRLPDGTPVTTVDELKQVTGLDDAGVQRLLALPAGRAAPASLRKQLETKAGKWDPSKHPRGEHGHFSHVWERIAKSMDPEQRRSVVGDVIGRRPKLTTRDFEGTVGREDHITRIQHGTVPTSAIADLLGVKGEKPGEHRNRQGERWQAFLDDVKQNGIKTPIFITVDPGHPPRISEGNHRRDAAVELGLLDVPVEIRYFGHSEREHSIGGPARVPEVPLASMRAEAPKREYDANDEVDHDWRVIEKADGSLQLIERVHADRSDEQRTRHDDWSIYRTVSDEDYQRMLDQGFLDTHGKMSHGRDEQGRGLMVGSATAESPVNDYAGDEQHHRLLKIRYDPADGWRKDRRDGQPDYVSTHERVPIDRLQQVSEPFQLRYRHEPDEDVPEIVTVTGDRIPVTGDEPGGGGTVADSPMPPEHGDDGIGDKGISLTPGVELAPVKPGKAFLKAVEKARGEMPDDHSKIGRRIDRPEWQPEASRLGRLMGIQELDRAKWQRALDTGLDPNTGEQMHEHERWSEQHMTYIAGRVEAQDFVDQYTRDRDRIAKNRDDYIAAVRARHGDEIEVADYDPADNGPGEQTMGHLQTVIAAGKAVDKEAQRRIRIRSEQLGIDEAGLQRTEDEAHIAWTEFQGQVEDGAVDYAANEDEAVRLQEAYLDAIMARRTGEKQRAAIARATYAEVLSEVRGMGPGADGGHDWLLIRHQQMYRKPYSDVGVGELLLVDGGTWRVDTTERRSDGTIRLALSREGLSPEVRETNEIQMPIGDSVQAVSQPPDLDELDKAHRSMQTSEGWYPTDWIDTSKAAGSVRLGFSPTGRGFHLHQGRDRDSDVMLSLGAAQVPGDDQYSRVATHELGHRMELAVEGLKALEWAFMWHRASKRKRGQSKREMEKLEPIYGGDWDEAGRKDKFPEHYSGKAYGDGPDSPSELFTTSMESLFNGSKYADDEMRRWALGILATV